jgi:hypothetical protein
VALIGVISNVHGLCTTYRWLAWLCDLPDVIVGIIQGILPPVLLVVLMMLLPIFLRCVFPATTVALTVTTLGFGTGYWRNLRESQKRLLSS